MADAQTIAGAQMVIVDGIGYDPWATQLMAANPVSGRLVLNVGQLVEVPVGGNPHRWYSPSNVHAVIDQISADYRRLDPHDAAYFAARRTAYLDRGLARYDQLIAAIKAKYAGTPVGASESIFAPLAQALGLRLLTPPSFLAAISEGTEPTAADKMTIDHQIAAHLIKVYVYNSQNATPDVQSPGAGGSGGRHPGDDHHRDPRAGTATFQAWQVSELEALQSGSGQGHRALEGRDRRWPPSRRPKRLPATPDR